MMRLKLCTIRGTAVYLHAATILTILLMLVTGRGMAALTATFSILLHEGAHAAVAALFGERPTEMELTPLGAIMRLEDEERLPPAKRLLMLVAGPVMTLLLCLLAIRGAAGGWMASGAARRLFLSNAAILAINVLPALPLDGGRITALVASLWFRNITVRRIQRVLSTVTAGLLILASFWTAWRYGRFNPTPAAAGCFILYSASLATTAQALHELRRLTDRRIMLESQLYAPVREIAVMDTMPLRRAVQLLAPVSMTRFTVMKHGSLRQLAVYDEQTLIAGYMAHPELLCGDLVRRNAQNLSKSKGSMH